LTFAGRIAWEKTVWTWTEGPQEIGFSLAHMYPGFFVLGLISSYLLMVLTIPVAVWLVKGWKSRSVVDIAMLILSFLTALAMLLPDGFFAR
jgi:uncharacterized membrane protein YqaE (UPF0057 family)